MGLNMASHNAKSGLKDALMLCNDFFEKMLIDYFLRKSI
jgi:hypothetical protein